MPTTTNNGWTTPADTDLVKNGALAIRTLGNAIDTTLGVYAAPGLVHINTTSFSAVASQSINNVFSATYQNYKVLINLTSVSATTTLRLRMRLSGTDNSGATAYQRSGYKSTTSALTNSYEATSSLFLSDTTSSGQVKLHLDILSPATTDYASIFGASFDDDSNNSYGINSIHRVATAYDGFTIYPATGTITGTIRVYGYKN